MARISKEVDQKWADKAIAPGRLMRGQGGTNFPVFP